MYNKTIFLENIIKIRENTGKNQENFFIDYEIGKYISNKPKSQQGKADLMSKMESGKKDFPASLLPLYAKLGNCSIDDLFHKSFQPKKDMPIKKVYRPYDICKMVVELSEQQNFSMALNCKPVKVSINETSFVEDMDENGYIDFMPKKITTDYYAFIFPNYEEYSSDAKYCEFCAIGNENDTNQRINKFLYGFFKYKEMKKKNIISEKDCKEGIEKLLSSIKDYPLSHGVYYSPTNINIDDLDSIILPSDFQAFLAATPNLDKNDPFSDGYQILKNSELKE